MKYFFEFKKLKIYFVYCQIVISQNNLFKKSAKNFQSIAKSIEKLKIKMYKKSTQPVQSLKKPPSRGGQSSSLNQPVSQRPRYIPPLSVNKDKKNQTVTKQSQFKSKDQQILNIVKQYLSVHGYLRTIQTLRRQKPMSKVGLVNSNKRKQATSVNNSVNQASIAKNQQQQKMIIKYFQRGQREQFFKHTLNKMFLASEDHLTASKLQFQLQIYFCIYNVHPTVNKSQTIEKSSLQTFKKYLQSRGSQLASEEQYLTYFSLPYISKPHQNPSFTYLFTKQYISKLKQKLGEFVHQFYQNQIQMSRKIGIGNGLQEKQKKCCQMEEIYDNYLSLEAKQQEQDGNGIKSRMKENNRQIVKDFKAFKESEEYQEVQDQIRKLKQKLDQSNEHRQYALNYVEKLSSNLKELAQSSKANLLESNKKWFLFAKDIIVMVRKAIKQQNIKIQGFQRFQGFFGKNIDQVINNADVSIFDKQSMMEDYSMVGDNRSKNITDKSNLGNGQKPRQQTSSQIDMVKIQSLFANAEDPQRQIQVILLLKALKNHFSKLKNPYGKREVIVQYSRHDICGVTPQKYYIQKKLLVDGSQKIREFYLRLTNDIAFDLYGIHYLTKSDKLIQNLMNVLRKQVVEETNAKKFVLAILQRFSYPIKSRKKMVQFGIVPLIFKVFESQRQSMSMYTLQYLTAMIMNLSLKKQCQKHFVPFKEQLMNIMIQLMCHQSEQIRNYVNGALYLLLSYKQLMGEAKKQHLQERIQQILDSYNSQEESIQLLKSGKQSSNNKSDEEKQKIMNKQLSEENNEEDEQAQSSIHIQYNYILKKLRGQIEIDSEQSEQEEQEDQNDEVEMDQFEEEDQDDDQDQAEEDDQSDYIDGEDDYINGQELLLKEYTLLGPQALKQQLLTRSVLDETAKRINNMTLSMNRSKRLDNIFAQKQKGSQQLIFQPQFDKLLGQENMNISREDVILKKKR